MSSPQAFDPAAGPATPVLVGFGEVGAAGAGGLPPLERLTDLLAIQLGRRPLRLDPLLAPDVALAALAAAIRSPTHHGNPVVSPVVSRDDGAEADSGSGGGSDSDSDSDSSDYGREDDNDSGTSGSSGSGTDWNGSAGTSGSDTNGAGGLACLPFDVGLPLADGRCWAEVLGAWRQPCLLVLSAAQLRTGLPAAGCALLRQGRVPLLGLLQWGDPWDQEARRRDGLPWLGLLRDPQAGDPPIAPSRLEEQLQAQLGLAGALARRWRQLRLG
ncbi:MAG: hypothetical protein VKJ44_03890 [Synechococcus sp.]|nr:hypothetical protein [Synechococcus sp.]